MSLFRQQVTVFIAENLSDAARSARLVSVAKAKLAEVIQSGQGSPNYATFVDGAAASSEAGARNVIVYEFNRLGDAAQFAIDYLRARAPVKSGRYVASFMIAVNGRPLSPASFNPESVPPGAQVIIYNTQGYNRKVDVQLIGTRRLRFSVPPGEYADCAAAINGRFGNSVKATRVYDINFPGKYTIRQAQRRSDRPHIISRAVGTPVQSPALIISPVG